MFGIEIGVYASFHIVGPVFCLTDFFLPVPSAPIGLTSEIVSENSMELRWNPPNNPNGIILEYQITFRGYATGNETVGPPYIISMH